MGTLFVRSEDGTYRERSHGRFRSLRRFVLIGVPLVLAATAGAYVDRSFRLIATASVNPKLATLLAPHTDTRSPSLQFAEEKFQARGGKYVYGPNDCSTFISDFLQKRGLGIVGRKTTSQLYNAAYMKSKGLVMVDLATEPVREFDVIVYRCYDLDIQGPSGHCGVFVWKDGNLCVEHNSSSNEGLAATPVDAFYEKMNSAIELQPPKIYRWVGFTKP